MGVISPKLGGCLSQPEWLEGVLIVGGGYGGAGG